MSNEYVSAKGYLSGVFIEISEYSIANSFSWSYDDLSLACIEIISPHGPQWSSFAYLTTFAISLFSLRDHRPNNGRLE